MIDILFFNRILKLNYLKRYLIILLFYLAVVYKLLKFLLQYD